MSSRHARMINALLVSAALLLPSGVRAQSDGIPDVQNVVDLRDDARVAREQSAVLVLISSFPGCVYCEYIKRHHLAPMVHRGELDGVAVVRELGLESGDVTDFNGEPIDAHAVGSRYGATFSPTVVFLDADGNALHEPIVGVESRDYYGYYLEKAIRKSLEKLRTGS